MRNRMVRRIFGLDGIVNVVLSQVKPPIEKKPEYPEQNLKAGTLKGIPEADKPLIRGLMMQLSNESNPAGRITADRDIQYLLEFYGERGVDITKLKSEYLLRREGLPYMRSGI